jgi:hypothetical protein
VYSLPWPVLKITPGTWPPRTATAIARGVDQFGVVTLAEGEPEHSAGGRVQHRDQVQLTLTGGNLGAVPEPFAVDLRRREDPLAQVRRPPAALGRPGRGTPSFPTPGGQVLRAHQAGDGVLILTKLTTEGMIHSEHGVAISSPAYITAT